jgi:choline monooxygenase
MKELADFIGDQELAELERPTGRASGLPGRVFSADFFELEQRRLFPRVWCPAAFASDIPDRGDVLPVDLAGWPILLLRDEEGVIRAFLNICRHRAMRVITQPCKGNTSLTCPWHAWTYDLTGRLIGTPKLGGDRLNQDAAFPTDGLALRPVRVGQWLDLIFVNIEDNAPPLDQHLRPLEDLLRPYYDLTDLHRAEAWSTEYPGNWKVAVETTLDEYHIPFLHPQLMAGVRRNNNANGYADGCYMMTSNARIYGDTREAGSAMGYGQGFPRILKASAPEPRSHFIVLFPTGALQTRPNHALLGLFLPEGPDRTRITFAHYYPGTTATDPAFASARQEMVQSWKEVFEQDVPIARDVHHNHKLRDHAGLATRMTPVWEEGVASFYRSLAAAMGASSPATAEHSSDDCRAGRRQT